MVIHRASVFLFWADMHARNRAIDRVAWLGSPPLRVWLGEFATAAGPVGWVRHRCGSAWLDSPPLRVEHSAAVAIPSSPTRSGRHHVKPHPQRSPSRPSPAEASALPIHRLPTYSFVGG